MIVSFAIALAGSGGVPAAIADRRFTTLERLSMVFGILSLLGAAPRSLPKLPSRVLKRLHALMAIQTPDNA
ncbi:MAG: hypothetical protein AAF974_03055 [Cyanobacteria bacterium P01_E01_bin.34]